MKILVYLQSVLVLFLAACSPGTGRTKIPVVVYASPDADELPGTWSGVVPCADCPGINYSLTLHPDGTYRETLVYQERESKPFTQSGTWQLNNGLLELAKQEAGHQKFMLQDKALVMLDAGGKVVSSGTAAMYRLQKEEPRQDGRREEWLQQKRDQGIDFIASGNEPFWSLEIDFEKQIRFKRVGGSGEEELTATVPLPEPPQEGTGTVYRATTEQGELVVEIIKAACTNNMSGQQSEYTVKIRTSGEELNGCGLYLFDVRLQGVWELQQLRGQDVTAAEGGRGVPALAFNLISNRVTGNAGCNRISGSFSIRGDEIVFGAIAGTKKSYPAIAQEQAFLETLSRSGITYQIENDTLLLRQGGQTMMAFGRLE